MRCCDICCYLLIDELRLDGMILDSFPCIESMIPRGCEVTIQPGGLGKVKAM